MTLLHSTLSSVKEVFIAHVNGINLDIYLVIQLPSPYLQVWAPLCATLECSFNDPKIQKVSLQLL